MHAMAKAEGEAAEVTRDEIAMWFQFLNAVALGETSVDPDKEVRKDGSAIAPLFKDHDIEYEQIFDSDEAAEIQLRSQGMMCHVIQDLFTLSHCLRNPQNEICKFYYYGAQDRGEHSEADHGMPEHKQELIKQCANCLRSIKNGEAYEYEQVLALSNDPQVSDGGAFT